MTDDLMRILAAWALVHETADEGWKAAVERGKAAGRGGMDAGPDAFVDGLSAMVAEEKERLKAELARSGGAEPAAQTEGDVGESIDALRFEVSELRGRIESLQASLDVLTEHLDED